MEGSPSGFRRTIPAEKAYSASWNERGEMVFCSEQEMIEKAESIRRGIPGHLISAADFVLATDYDLVFLDSENLRKSSGEVNVEAYMEFMEKKFEAYSAATMILYKMIRLEESIKSSNSPGFDNLSDADLKSLVEKQLRREDHRLPEQIIVRRLKCSSRVYIKASNDIEEEEAEEICPICMENYEEEEKEGEKIARLEYCAHEFHANCIKAWLTRKNRCPTCRNLGLLPKDYLDWVSNDMGMLRSFFKRDLVPLPSNISRHSIYDVRYVVTPTMKKLGLLH